MPAQIDLVVEGVQSFGQSAKSSAELPAVSSSVNAGFSWLDSELNGDELFYTRLVASTIHCPAAGQGFLVAFGLAIDSLEALSQAWVQNSTDISHVVQAVKNARACLIASTTLSSVVRSLPDLKPLPKSYSLWHSSVDKARSNSDARRVRQALGLTLLWHMGKGEEIGESISDALKILVDCSARRGHHSQFWKDIIPLIKPESTVLEGLSKEVRHDPIVKLLRTLAGYGVTCVIPVSPAVRYPEEKSDEDLGSDTQTSGERSEDRYSQSETNEPEEDVLEEGSPIIRWQASRATRAPWPQVLGLENWDILSPPLLKAVLAHIPGSFTNNDVSAYAILSAVSLVSALPARLALTLPVTQNDDIWVDIRNAHVCWNLAQLVPRTATSEEIWAGGHQPSQIVRLPLPKLAAVALNKKYINRESSGNLLAFLFGDGAQTEDVLHEYGRFLRSGGATSDIPSSYSARIAYSFGAVVHQVSGNKVLAALASLDLRLSAPAELDYLCIREDAISNAVSGAFSYLGFGECVETPDPRYVGSPLCPKPEIVRNSLQQIRDEMSSIVGRVTPRMPISRFVKEFNRLSELSAKAFVILSAHRGSKLERSNFTSLYSSTEYFQLNDKLTQNNSTRIIPKISPVKSLLNGHLAALRSLAKRLAKEHPATADKINKISNLERPFSPVFFTVEIDTVAALRPVRLEQQSIDGAETGMAKNGGRHFIVSELVRRKVYAPLIRVITGHAREAAATFNPAGGLSPAEACEYLRPLLEDVYADVAPASWPSLLLPSSVLPRVTILPKTKRRGAISELEVADDFDPPPIRPKEPFHNQTLAYSSLGDLIVKELLSGASELSTWVVVFNSLMFVELLWQPSRIASAWESISKKDIWRLGNTLILRIERPSEQPVSMPLHPITTMMVNAAWQSPIPSYPECVTMTRSWISSLTLNTIWASEPDSFLDQYSEIARAYHVIRLPPWLVTAGSTEMEAAAISISSIARIAYGRPGLFDAPERRVPRKSPNRSDRDLLSQVIRIVNHMGDNTKHYGEDGARKTTLTDNLRKWKANCGISIGIAVDVADWVVAECKKRKNEKSHLEVSSMSIYLSRLRPFLEKVELNEELEDLDGTQWEEGRRLVLGDSTGDSQKQASSIYRHFARFWRSRGCIAISNDILWDPQNQERIGRCHNASSTYVTTREAEAIVGVMTRSFEAGSLDEARAALYAQLNTSIAFRPAEVGLIHFQHTFPDLDALEVTTSGYSHLKHPKSSRRRISVPRSICEVLASLKKRILSAHPKSRGYFLSTAPESDHTHIADIRSAMHYALRFITGEALVKQHSLRGSAECRLVWPEFEQAIQSMQNCNPPPKMDRAPEKRWNDVGLAAVSAGHHPLSAIKYYLSMWPIFFYAANYQCNSDFRPRSGFSRFLPGIKEENIRQVLSRSAVRLKRAEVSNSDHDKLERKDVWQELLCRSHFSSDIKSIEDLMQPTSRSRTEVAPEELQPARQALKISYLALRFNGWSRELSADTFGLSAADSKWLDQAIPDVDVFSRDSSERGISIKFAREECPEMSAAIAGCTDLDRLKLGFLATSSEKRNSASPLTHVIEAARILLSLIPPRLTLTVLPEMDQEQAQLRSVLNNMDSAIEIKPQSLVKTMRYRIQIVPRDKSRQGPRPQGRYTRLFRALLRSQISILLHEKNNDQK